MPSWATWVLVGVVLLFVVSVLAGLIVGASSVSAPASTAPSEPRRSAQPLRGARESRRRYRRRCARARAGAGPRGRRRRRPSAAPPNDAPGKRVRRRGGGLRRERRGNREVLRPDVVILDVTLPGKDGLTFCRELKRSPRSPHVILLTGGDIEREGLRSAGADAVLRKPFSPVELLMLVDKVSHETVPVGGSASASQDEQLLIYARDLSRVVEVERGQRRLLQHAYRQTVTALADALGGERPVDGSSRPSCPTLRARARSGVRRVAGRRSQSRVRVPAPRRR